jgi:hypothetical protein
MSEELKYVLLNHPLPASVAPHMLGRVVLDPKNPLDGYVPEDPPIKHQYRSEVTQLDIQTAWGTSKNIIRVRYSRPLGKFVEALKSEKMITRSLFQPRSVFNDIYGSDALPSLYRTELLQMLSEKSRGVGYFVTSFKSIVNDEFVGTEESSTGRTASARSANTLFDPGSLAVHSGPLAVGPASSSRNSASETTALKIDDEVIIAIAYRLVGVYKPLLPIRTRPIKIELGAPMKVESWDQLPSHFRSRPQAELRFGEYQQTAQEPLRPHEPLEEIPSSTSFSIMLRIIGKRILSMIPSVQNVKATMINRLVSFFTSAFYELMDELEILERPLSLGKKRVRWRCVR